MQLVKEGTVAIRKSKIAEYEIGKPYYVPRIDVSPYNKYDGERLLTVLDTANDDKDYFLMWLMSRGGAVYIESIDELGAPAPYNPANDLLAKTNSTYGKLQIY